MGVSYFPDQFKLFIGGYMGPSYCLEKKDNRLMYRVFEYNFSSPKEIEIKPSRIKWKNFWNKMEEIGIWNWKEDYLNPGITDGTQWHVEIEVEGKFIKSHGDNNYPGN